MPPEEIPYKRSRFSTRLLEHRLYTAGHSWLEQEDEDVWRVGFTKFAVRMLGEIVELGFETAPGTPVETGQVIGWLEGFKAVTDMFSPLPGRFEGFNSAMNEAESVRLLTTDPYGRGWLFRVRGRPGDECMDVQGYISLLDTTIDKMLGQRHE
jgi:glycine cleavage system H protein